MPKIGETGKPKLLKCIACQGTGKNSKGGDCVPCVRKARVSPTIQAAAAPPPVRAAKKYRATPL